MAQAWTNYFKYQTCMHQVDIALKIERLTTHSSWSHFVLDGAQFQLELQRPGAQFQLELQRPGASKFVQKSAVDQFEPNIH